MGLLKLIQYLPNDVQLIQVIPIPYISIPYIDIVDSFCWGFIGMVSLPQNQQLGRHMITFPRVAHYSHTTGFEIWI